jgi:hypothetical protein
MTRSVLIAATIALGLSPNLAAAHSTVGDPRKPSVHTETHSAAHNRNRLMRRGDGAHRSSRRAVIDGPPAFYATPPGVPVYRWPGYTYVPRQGIVDEACNLPTSACPNEMRDIR